MNNIFKFFRESRTARMLIPMGIMFIVIGVFLFIIDNNTKNYIKTEGIVSKAELVEEESIDADGNHIDATYDVYVKYTVDGKEYDELLGTISGYKEGDKIIIAYNPEKPNEITQQTGIIVPIVLVVAGIASLIGGVVSAKNAIKKNKELKIQEESWKNGK